MITPRRTRLCRVPDLAAFRTTIADAIFTLTPDEARDTVVLVPTHAAAEQLRRTVEDRGLTADRRALVWPILGTRHDLYDQLASRLSTAPTLLSAFEREVILSAVARDVAEDGLVPPFQMRPGLVAEMLALYDQIHWLGRSIDDFERNFHEELEREQETDRGAARLLQQTRFLAAVYRGYQERVAESGRSDEHGLRDDLLKAELRRPLRRVVITVADRLADPDGLWPADFDLLTRLPDLERLELVCTENLLAAGFLERVHAALPGLEEARSPIPARCPPRLLTPAGGASAPDDLTLGHRDREEELASVARRLKDNRHTGSAAALDRTALVVRRPLPYLYLARDVFADASIPFETLDTLPLAAEPYAAAIDLALDAVAGDFTRGSLLALLRSPHFHFYVGDGGSNRLRQGYGGPPKLDAKAEDPPLPVEGEGDVEVPAMAAVSDAAIAACDFALADVRYLGGFERLESLISEWERIGVPASREQRRQQTALPAARGALIAAVALRPLAEDRLMTDQITTFVDFLRRFDRPTELTDPTQSRRLRVRAAVLTALTALDHAFQRHDPTARGDVIDLTSTIRRWLGSQTVAIGSGTGGLQILDAQAARYGEFDDVQIVGLIDGEWPERIRRNVLYPASLMALLEPLPAASDPVRRDREVLNSARASFKDLLCSSGGRVRLSTFALEHDAVVEPSVLLDDVPGYGLPTEHTDARPIRVSYAEALALEPRQPWAVPAVPALWAAARLEPDDRAANRFRGEAGPWTLPRVSVSRLERYLDCPFRFFASEVLKLEEQPEDEDTRTPLERGRFLHELWERFFAEWQRRGHGRIEPDRVGDARALFVELCEESLARLSPSEAALERNRLLGSAVSPGIAHRVFTMEADRPTRITERLLEYPLQGDFTFQRRAGDSRAVTLSAKADRIDVLADGTLRVIDYKSKKTPDLRQALQLPIYSFCARDRVRTSRGGAWTIAEALYLSFEGDKAVVALRAKGRTTDELLDDAQERLLDALDDIGAGHFPPSPARKSLCAPCPYRAVCRLEIVELTDGRPEGGTLVPPDITEGGTLVPPTDRD